MARVRCVSATVFIVLALAACNGGTAGAPAVMGAQVRQVAVPSSAASADAPSTAASTVVVASTVPDARPTTAPAVTARAVTETTSTRTVEPDPTARPIPPPSPASAAVRSADPAREEAAKPAPVAPSETGSAITPFAAKPAAVVPTLPARASLGPLEFISQTLNNCGPASVAEVLSYWGIQRSQGQVQAILRADGNPRGMVPYGVPAYMHSMGMDVVMGVGGTRRWSRRWWPTASR